MWAWLSQLLDTAGGAIGGAASSVGSALGGLFSSGAGAAGEAAASTGAEAGVAAGKAGMETGLSAAGQAAEMPLGAAGTTGAATPTQAGQVASQGGMMQDGSQDAAKAEAQSTGQLGNLLKSLMGDSNSFSKMTGLDPQTTKALYQGNQDADKKAREDQLAAQRQLQQQLALQQQQVWGGLGGFGGRR